MADNLSGEPQITAALAKLASFAPGFAGAVLSLAFIENLTVRGRMVAVAVGLACAAFLAPAAADMLAIAWQGAMPYSVRNAIQFLVALCGMGSLPPLMAQIKKLAGDPLSLLKPRIGAGGGGQ